MFKSFQRLSMIVLFVMSALGGFGIKPASSGAPFIFTVNYDADVNDFVLNSVCSIGTPTGGFCTLRAAIAEANAIAASMDVIINIPAGTYELTIAPELINTITSGDLDFPQANTGYTIYLIGTSVQPAVIDANQLDRVVDISMGVNIQMENIVIKGGLLSWTGAFDYPDGAGILNLGNLKLTEVAIEENEARCGQETCTFQISGGGIQNGGTVYMTDSKIRNNTSVNSSAIISAGASGRFFIKNSTISGNHATEAFTMANYAHMHIRNSTISGNDAGPGYIAGMTNYGTLYLESSTIANSGVISSIYNGSEGSVTIHDSILKNNPEGGSGNCQNFGTWTSTGYNIYSDNTCPLTGTGDLGSTDPLLGALGNNGGPTWTMPLLEGSPAEDHRTGTCTNIPESPVLPPLALTVDQRYFGRTDGDCDTGAVEGTLDMTPFYLPIIFR